MSTRPYPALARRNADKDRCDAGHPFDEDNTYVRPDGAGRQCRTCNRAAARAYQRRRRASRRQQ